MRNEAGAIAGAVVVFRDLSALRHAQHRLEGMVCELESSNAELESFCYAVSHDLRALLRTLDGFSQALLEDYAEELGEEAADYLDRIRAGSQRMGLLIDDLLNLSRITRASLDHEEIDLSALAHDVVAELVDAEPERRVEVVISPGVRGRGDVRLVRVLLVNLLGNAWKFTAKREAARVEFGQDTATGVPRYFVRDNGAGFSMEYADNLFEPFQRLHAANEFEGNGIGLATVRRIVARHGGKASAVAEPDKGATIYFTLNGGNGQ